MNNWITFFRLHAKDIEKICFITKRKFWWLILWCFLKLKSWENPEWLQCKMIIDRTTFLTVYVSWCFPDRSEVLSSASKLWLRSVFLKIDKLHIYDCSKKMVHFHIQYLMALISEPVQLYGTVFIKSRCWSIWLYKQMCRHQNNLFSFAKKRKNCFEEKFETETFPFFSLFVQN